MRAMKDSGIEWIKDIPINWNVCKGKNILNIHKRTYPENYEVVTCFRDGQVTARSNRREEGFTFSDKEIGYQGVNIGDLVIHGMDGFAGSIGISDSMGKASPVLNVCTPKNGHNTKFLMYYLRMLAAQNVFLALATGIRERSCDLRWNKIAELLFPIPDETQQTAIADYLDRKCAKIGTTIEREKQHIEKLKEYRQSVITEAVTKGLDPTAEMKDSGIEWIGKVPQGWEIVRLRFLCNINTGTKDTINRVDDGLYPFYVRSPNIEKINTYGFDGEAILMAGDGVGAGKVFHYVKGKFDYHQRVYNLHNIKKVAIKFLYYFLSENFWKEIEQGNAKSTVDSIRLPMILNFPVSVPNESEQTEIADYLDCKTAQIDAVIAKKETLIEKLTEYKKSLIYEAVTGKMEI